MQDKSKIQLPEVLLSQMLQPISRDMRVCPKIVRGLERMQDQSISIHIRFGVLTINVNAQWNIVYPT